jgi:hypothetical protein
VDRLKDPGSYKKRSESSVDGHGGLDSLQNPPASYSYRKKLSGQTLLSSSNKGYRVRRVRHRSGPVVFSSGGWIGS